MSIDGRYALTCEPLDRLVERCRNSEEDAVCELVARFRGWALDLASSLVQDGSLAEDVVQEAFVAALLRLDELRDPHAFPGWLRQIVRTQANRVTRRRREAQLRMEEAEACAIVPTNSAEAQDLREHVRGAVRGLPQAMRDATELFYLEGRSCSEISAMLDIPHGTVKRRLHDARVRLRDVLLETLGSDARNGG